MAAAVLHRPAFTIAHLVAELRWTEDATSEASLSSTEDNVGHGSVRWVEAVGGVRSPLADDGDTVDLCDALSPELVVLVADAGLGTINAVLLSVAALANHQVVTMLNRYNPAIELHRRNLDWLVRRCHLDVLTDPSLLAGRIMAQSGETP